MLLQVGQKDELVLGKGSENGYLEGQQLVIGGVSVNNSKQYFSKYPPLPLQVLGLNAKVTGWVVGGMIPLFCFFSMWLTFL